MKPSTSNLDTLLTNLNPSAFTYGEPVVSGDERCSLFLEVAEDDETSTYVGLIIGSACPGDHADGLLVELMSDQGDVIASTTTERRGRFSFPVDVSRRKREDKCHLRVTVPNLSVTVKRDRPVLRVKRMPPVGKANGGPRPIEIDRSPLPIICHRQSVVIPNEQAPYGVVCVIAMNPKDDQDANSLLVAANPYGESMRRAEWDVRDLVSGNPKSYAYDAWGVTTDRDTRHYVTVSKLKALAATVSDEQELRAEIERLMTYVAEREGTDGAVV